MGTRIGTTVYTPSDLLEEVVTQLHHFLTILSWTPSLHSSVTSDYGVTYKL